MPAPDDAAAQELAPLRSQIDALDGRIVRLLNERAEIVVRIGHLKQKSNEPVYAPDREQVVLGKVRGLNRRAAAGPGAWRRSTAS